MAAISISIKRGVAGTKISDFTVGTSAPGANDIELRYNTTDTNSANLTKLDIILALHAFERKLTELEQSPAGTYVITAPPL